MTLLFLKDEDKSWFSNVCKWKWLFIEVSGR